MHSMPTRFSWLSGLVSSRPHISQRSEASSTDVSGCDEVPRICGSRCCGEVGCGGSWFWKILRAATTTMGEAASRPIRGANTHGVGKRTANATPKIRKTASRPTDSAESSCKADLVDEIHSDPPSSP